MPKKKKTAPHQKQVSTTAIVPAQAQALSVSEAIEKVLILGDLSSLEPKDRIDYYNRVCKSLGLNPLTMPFSYILFREGDNAPAKLALYANKSCTEQLRKIHGVSVLPPLRREMNEDICMVEADVRDKTGRTDSATGSVALFRYKDGKRIAFSGKELCNAIMKCETKAKRRATLSICGLAFLDESELDNMEVLGGVTPQGRIYYNNPDDMRGGSRKAQERVLEEKLAGTPKEAEIVDAGQPAPQHSGNKRQVALDWSSPQDPILTGDTADLVPRNAKPYGLLKGLSVTWGKDEFWHVGLDAVKDLRTICAESGYELTELHPKSSGDKGKPEAKPSGASTKPNVAAEDAAKRSQTGPTTVSGTIEKSIAGMCGTTPVRDVTLLMVDKKRPSYRCFDKGMFKDLDAGIGKAAILVMKQNKTFLNIVGALKIGAKQWLEDGTPCIQQDREPTRTLF